MNKADARKAQDSALSELSIAKGSLIALQRYSNELQAIIDAPDVYEPPVKTNNNWLANSLGEAQGEITMLDDYIKQWAEQGSVWPTERLARIASLRIKITNYLGHIQYELCPDFVPEWEDDGQVKYRPVIDYGNDNTVSTSWTNRDFTGGVTFQTSDQAIEAGNRVKHLVDELNELIRGK